MKKFDEQIYKYLYVLLKEQNKQIIDSLIWPNGLQSIGNVLLPYMPSSCLYMYFNIEGEQLNLNLVGFAKVGYHRFYQLKNDPRVKKSTHYIYALLSYEQLLFLKQEVKYHEVYLKFQRDGSLPK